MDDAPVTDGWVALDHRRIGRMDGSGKYSHDMAAVLDDERGLLEP
jgi:hypothetical protein